jgi:uncharacterized membrane protein
MSLEKLTAFLHQRYLWVFGALLAVIVAVIIAILSTKNIGQINLLSNVFFICLVLLPMLLCSILFFVIILVGIYGVRKLEIKSKRTIGGLQETAQRINRETLATAEKLNRNSIGLGSRFSQLEKIFKR